MAFDPPHYLTLKSFFMATLKGIIRQRQTKQPLGNLKISAFNKDNNVGQYIGAAVTDARGRFNINFEFPRPAHPKEQQRINIYFLVYHGNKVIYNTEDRPLTDLKQAENLVLEVELKLRDQSPANYFVNGKIIDSQTKQTVAGLRIEAWGKSEKKNEFLNQSSTDNKGSFFIAYDLPQSSPGTIVHPPAIFFRIYAGETLIHNTEAQLLQNPGQLNDIVIEIRSIAEEIAPGREKIFDRADITIIKRSSHQRPQELQKSNPELYNKLLLKAQQHLRESVAKQFHENSLEVKIFIRKLDLNHPSIRRGEALSSFLVNSICNSNLSDFGKQEALATAERWAGPLSEEEILQPDIPLKENPAFQPEFRRADLFQTYMWTNLRDQTLEQLSEKELSIDQVNPETLEGLVQEKILSSDEANRLGLNINLLQISNGDYLLAETLKNKLSENDRSSLRQLAFMQRTDWEKLIEQNNIAAEGNTDKKKYAAFMRKQFEMLFPTEAFISNFRPLATESTSKQLREIQPLLKNNPRLFDNISFQNLDLREIADGDYQRLNENYDQLHKTVNRYPGLQLSAVVTNNSLSPEQKIAEMSRRVNLLDNFYKEHDDEAFLFLDYSPDSEDLKNLPLQKYSERDQKLILGNLKASQRMYFVTQDAEDSYRLMENGYHAAHQIASDSYNNFLRSTQLENNVARAYYKNAQELSKKVIANGGTILDYIFGGLDWMTPGNTPPEVIPYLRRLDGFASLFGNQNYCKCSHCQSIISPAAYFVDLMDFLKKNVLDEHFTGADYSHILNPRKRRPDLWESLELTCENTNELIPYLIIINEVLENYIVTRPASGFSGSINNRTAVEDFVYTALYNLATIRSFNQPFLLPLAELEIYLNHFPITRERIARTVLSYLEDTNHIIPQAQLRLSLTEYNLITTPNATSAFLNSLYRMNFPSAGPVPAQDVQVLLQRVEINRKQFTELIECRFISDNGANAVTIHQITSPGSMQPDKEEVHSLTLPFLDRMHRFLRLQQHTDWSIEDLDQLLYHLRLANIITNANELPIPLITRLWSLQKRLKLKMPELIGLFWTIPVDEEPSQFDLLFNQPAFLRQGIWDPATLSLSFQHPAYRTDLPDTTGTGILHRLLAGLVINDDNLFLLIENLKTSLGSAVDGSFVLNIGSLSSLNRHARLARSLKISVQQLFSLLRLQTASPDPVIDSIAKVEALLELVDWWKESKYTVDELAFILGSETSDDFIITAPDELASDIIDQVITEEQLIFADTLFSYFPAITEAQSIAIVAANPSVIGPANIRSYRIAGIVTDPNTVVITIPASITAELSSEDQTLLLDQIKSIISTHMQPGAADIPDHVLVGTVNLNRPQSQNILDANPAIFEAVETAVRYWLLPSFNPSVSINIPAGIPLSADSAKEYLLQFYVGEIIPVLIGRGLNLQADKVKNMVLLAGHNFSDPVTGNTLTQIAQGLSAPSLLVHIVLAVLKLGIWFKDAVFTADVLNFIKQNSGSGNHVFPTADFNVPVLDDVKKTFLFQKLLKKAALKTSELFAVLTAFDFTGTHQFSEDVLDELTVLLKSELGIVTALNQVLAFPATDPVTNSPANRSVEALTKLDDNTDIVNFLGIGGEALPLMLSNDYQELSHSVEAIVAAIRTKYDTEKEYKEKIESFEDKIRERKRDALTDYFIHTLDPVMFQYPNDLYHFFLIDTELEGCARTSRVVAGISSLQLYIQRCVLNLEQSQDDHIHVLPTDIPENEWVWRKNYRVWEANRKVFLWPENFIEPDLRDDKTPLFKELESELLQEDINAQTVQNAYAKYMKGFIEVAHLKIAGAYHENTGSRDVLHLFGVTAGDPPEYYYRTIENIYNSQELNSNKGIVWGHWEKVNVQISSVKVSPIVHLNRLYVFWVELFTKPKNEIIQGTQLFAGYQHTMVVKFTSLNLDGSWTAPQQLSLQHSIFDKGPGIIWDPLVSENERANFFSQVTFSSPVMIAIAIDPNNPLSPYYTNDAFIKAILKTAKDGEGIMNQTSFPVLVEFPGGGSQTILLDFTSSGVRNLLKPAYENTSNDLAFVHTEPRDNYTLRGYKWDRVYPSTFWGALTLTGRNFEMDTFVDLYEKKAKGIAFVSYGTTYKTSSFKRLTLDAGNVEFGYPSSFNVWEPYAAAVRASYNKNDLVDRTKLLSFSTSNRYVDMMIVNGTLTDGLLNINGDLLYLQSNSFWPWAYKLRRLGTTLSDKMGRRLFEAGFDGLLDVYYQGSSLKEASLPFTDTFAKLFNNTLKNVQHLDTTGSMGVYFREILLHIPSLLANHLNSQGKYEDAQRWYHYIFNPTSDKLPSDYDTIIDPVQKKKREKDRVWQFIEFRNHTLQTLKEQLNDKDAIYAYENDPFNPHAIARLRLGGYMKNIVMKYIDNLLDWGDNLFAMDTMESINEATLLYVMAAEILGPRPFELGDCPEGDHGKTFNEIYSQMQSVSEEDNFIIGLETVGNTGKYLGAFQTSPEKYMIENIVTASEKAAQHITIGGFFSQKYYGAPPSRGDAIILPSLESSAPILERITIDASVTSAISGTISTATETDFLAGMKSNTSFQIQNNAYFKGADWKIYNPWANFPLASFGTSFLQQAHIFCIPQNKDLLTYWDRVEDRLYKIRNCMNISGVRRQLALFAPEIDPRLLVRARAEGLSLQDILNNLNGNLPPYRFNYLILKAKEYAGMLQSFGNALMVAMEKKDAEELNRLRLMQQVNIMKLSTKMRDQEIETAEYSLESLKRRKDTIVQRRNHYTELISTNLTGLEQAQAMTKHAGNLLVPTMALLFLISGQVEYIPKIVGMANSTGGDENAKALEKFGSALRFTADSLLKISDSMALEANFQRRKQGWQFQLDQTNSELTEMDTQIKAAEVRLEISRQGRELHVLSVEHLEETFEYYENKFSNLGMYTWLSTQLQRLHRAAYQDALAMARLAEQAYRFEKNDDTTPLLDGNYWDATKSGMLSGDRLQSDLRAMERKYMETHYRTMEIDQAFSLMQIDPASLLQLKTTGECSFTIPELYFDLFYPGQYRRRIKSARLTIPCITGPFTNVSATLTLKESFIRKDPMLGEENLLAVPPMRSVTIATSTAQNDSGVFRLDFRDERYMPFEGGGAVQSTWGLMLPKSFRLFDYTTINDVILHISYTAEYDGVFREQIEGQNATIVGEIQTLLESNSLPRLFSLRQEFSSTFHRLFHQAITTAADFELSERHFPLFLQGRGIKITNAKLILLIDKEKTEDDSGNLPMIDLDITITGNSGSEANVNSYMMDPDLQLPTATIAASIFTDFQPGIDPLTITMGVNDPGVFTPDDTSPGLPVMDSEKLKDILIMFEYCLST